MIGLRNILVLVFFVGLCGCYQVSEDDLFEDYESKIVIEAEITNLAPPYFVYISHSAHPADSVDYYPIADAQIIISDSRGNSELLKTVNPGIFIANEIIGIPGIDYSLNILVDEQSYRANEIMLQPSVVLKTEIKYIDEFVSDTGNYIKLFIQKDSELTSYYKIEVLKNDSLYNSYSDLIIFEDAFANDTIEYLVPYAFDISDSVTINLHAISNDMYRYYYTLNKQTNNTFSNIQTPLKNPPTNINNQPLGYFHVSAITQLKFKIE